MHAVKQIGPDAIPFLLRWVQLRTLRLDKTGFWAAQHPFVHFRIYTDFHYYVMAQRGFNCLGNDAKAAWPTLIQWTYSKDQYLELRGLDTLEATSPDRKTFLPILLRLILDSDTDIQGKQASSILSYIV